MKAIDFTRASAKHAQSDLESEMLLTIEPAIAQFSPIDLASSASVIGTLYRRRSIEHLAADKSEGQPLRDGYALCRYNNCNGKSPKH